MDRASRFFAVSAWLGGQALQLLALELWSWGCSLSYGLTPERVEMDFVVRRPDGSVRPVQVCADLQDAAPAIVSCGRCSLCSRPAGRIGWIWWCWNRPHGRMELPAGVRLVPAVQWLLEDG